jgi:hypothetical protein
MILWAVTRTVSKRLCDRMMAAQSPLQEALTVHGSDGSKETERE